MLAEKGRTGCLFDRIPLDARMLVLNEQGVEHNSTNVHQGEGYEDGKEPDKNMERTMVNRRCMLHGPVGRGSIGATVGNGRYRR